MSIAHQMLIAHACVTAQRLHELTSVLASSPATPIPLQAQNLLVLPPARQPTSIKAAAGGNVREVVLKAVFAQVGGGCVGHCVCLCVGWGGEGRGRGAGAS